MHPECCRIVCILQLSFWYNFVIVNYSELQITGTQMLRTGKRLPAPDKLHANISVKFIGVQTHAPICWKAIDLPECIYLRVPEVRIQLKQTQAMRRGIQTSAIFHVHTATSTME